MIKWMFLAALLGLAGCAIQPPAALDKQTQRLLNGDMLQARAESSPDVNAADWGPYAQMVGKSWLATKGKYDYRVTVEWQKPGMTLIERWFVPDNPPYPGFGQTNTIQRSATPGELIIDTMGGLCNRTGHVQQDGSLLTACKYSLQKLHERLISPQPGTVELQEVKVDGDKVTQVINSVRLTRELSDAKKRQQAEAVAIDKTVWGAYADLVGRTWATEHSGSQWQITIEWAIPGKELTERWAQANSGPAFRTDTITPGDATGELRRVSKKDVCSERTGRIQSDGSILFTCTGMFKLPLLITAPEPGVMVHNGAKLKNGQVAAIIPAATYKALLTSEEQAVQAKALAEAAEAARQVQELAAAEARREQERLQAERLAAEEQQRQAAQEEARQRAEMRQLMADAQAGKFGAPVKCRVAYASLADFYSGGCRDGLANGLGVARGKSLYVGHFRDGVMQGRGIYISASGTRYEGEFHNDKMHGQGAYSWASGARYVGEFHNNIIQGQGTYHWPNGAHYVGAWRDDKRAGQGSMTWANGAHYVGAWRDDKRVGQGSMTWANGDTYTGQFVNHEPVGQTAYQIRDAQALAAQQAYDDYEEEDDYQEPTAADFMQAFAAGFNSELAHQQQLEAQQAQMLAQLQAQADRQRERQERERATELARQRAAEMEHVRQLHAQQDFEREQRARQQAQQQQQLAQRNTEAEQLARQQEQQRAEEARRREATEDERRRLEVAAAERRAQEEIARREQAERDALARSKQLEQALKRQEEEARNRPVAYREGITLCAPPKKGGKAWLCRGPLQSFSGVLDTKSGDEAVRFACGGSNWRDLGMVAGYRAYGCGYGIHPTAREYPGNRDIPADLGVGYIPDRGTFYCNPKQVFAYCKHRG